MPRKTRYFSALVSRAPAASMRPRPDAAENADDGEQVLAILKSLQ